MGQRPIRPLKLFVLSMPPLRFLGLRMFGLIKPGLYKYTVQCTAFHWPSKALTSDLKNFIKLKSALWNRNNFLRFRFRLLKSYGSGSGSYFWKVTVTVPVSVPVPAPYLKHNKQTFQDKFWEKFCLFITSKLFYKEKVYKFQQIYCKMGMKKILDEGNQIHNFISSSVSGTVINYGPGSDFLTSYGSGSGSTSQKVTVPTVPLPVPQRWLKYKMYVCSVQWPSRPSLYKQKLCCSSLER